MIYYNNEPIFKKEVYNTFGTELLETIDNIFKDDWCFENDNTIIGGFVPSENDIIKLYKANIDVEIKIRPSLLICGIDTAIFPELEISIIK